MAQTFFDVVHKGGQFDGLKCNISPLRRKQADEMAANTWKGDSEIIVVPTRDKLWEDTYGDDAKAKRKQPAKGE